MTSLEWRCRMVPEYRAMVTSASDEQLQRLLTIELHTEEWRWNAVADEVNRRRKARRLAKTKGRSK